MAGIEDNIKRLASQQSKIRNKALKLGAEMIRKEMEQNTPVGIGPTHAKDHTVITAVNKDGEVSIGFDKKVSFRVHFVELGTIKQKPQPFMQRTQKDNEAKFFELVQDELRKGLGL